MSINAQQLQAICPTLTADTAGGLAHTHNVICPGYKIDTPLRMAAFIAMCAEESQEYSRMEENLNYSKARLMEVFPRYFPDAVTADRYSGKPEAIANRVYASRMRNGDEASGDGWTYRGGGFIQLTGKDMYQQFAGHIGHSLPDAVACARSGAVGALDSAAWLFAVNKKLLDYADAGDLMTITKRVNGGMNGWTARKAYYDRAIAALG